MIDYSVIQQTVSNTRQDFEVRVAAIKGAFQQNPPNFYDIPKDVYVDEDFVSIEASELEDKFKQLTYGYLSRQPDLLLDLDNCLVILGRLQAISLLKMRSTLEEAPTAENQMAQLFTMAAIRETKKTQAFKEGIKRAWQISVSSVQHFGLSPSQEVSEITLWCEAQEPTITMDMSREEFDIAQTQVYEHICKTLLDLSELGLDKIDVELGYLKHSSGEDLDEQTIQRKVVVFNGLLNDVLVNFSKCDEYLEALQRHLSPKASKGMESRPH